MVTTNGHAAAPRRDSGTALFVWEVVVAANIAGQRAALPSADEVS
jgi:hypothetical protein